MSSRSIKWPQLRSADRLCPCCRSAPQCIETLVFSSFTTANIHPLVSKTVQEHESSASGFLTVQLDVVAHTPVAPQRRLVQSRAANLDAVFQQRLQLQGQLCLSERRRHLETAEKISWASDHNEPNGISLNKRSSNHFLLNLCILCQQ